MCVGLLAEEVNLKTNECINLQEENNLLEDLTKKFDNLVLSEQFMIDN